MTIVKDCSDSDQRGSIPKMVMRGCLAPTKRKCVKQSRFLLLPASFKSFENKNVSAEGPDLPAHRIRYAPSAVVLTE